ncbi:putative ABC transporter permease [Clostridium sp. BL-8]|uniref:putative ABC transporter permease n=1 Tax=Clostridium sp. BL-8 TaxID=349938 RepID=UPI00098C32C9|nr:putative ABC transporter permease [Clostridium sp. BL-8]OOM74490.1 hypothetical protein CLOBL_43400 [Clostridium sp. BL-8]
MNNVYIYFIYFLIYSFGGWVCETSYCSIIDKQYVNRGFLKGPFCPVYGFGALAVIILLTPISNNIIILYLSAMICASVLEYTTGFLLETVFNLKWWDYSNYRFNIKGRVCLVNSMMFGILSLILVEFIHPLLSELVMKMTADIIMWIFSISSLYFLIDTATTTYKVLQFSGKLKEMYILLEEIKEKSEIYKGILQQNINKFDVLIDQQNDKIVFAKEQINKLKINLEKIIMKNKSSNKRIFRAFPNIKSLKYQYSLERLKEELKKIRKK